MEKWIKKAWENKYYLLISFISIAIGKFLFFYDKKSIILKIISFSEVIIVHILTYFTQIIFSCCCCHRKKGVQKTNKSSKEMALENGHILLHSIENEQTALENLEHENDDECTALLNSIKAQYEKRKNIYEKNK